jgi:hypothetical protein
MYRRATLWSCAATAIGFALVVYALDRNRVGDTWFIPGIFQTPAILFPVGIGSWFPSAAHTFAFATACTLVWAANRQQARLVCFAWMLFELSMEMVQMPGAAAVLGLNSSADVSRWIARGLYGTFAAADVSAILSGGLLACWMTDSHYREVDYD